MKILDGRGKGKTLDCKRNKKAVKKWFTDNPNSTIKACCEGVKLTYPTVRRHIESLQKEMTEC